MKNVLVKQIEEGDEIKDIMIEYFNDENMLSFYPIPVNEKYVFLEWYKKVQFYNSINCFKALFRTLLNFFLQKEK